MEAPAFVYSGPAMDFLPSRDSFGAPNTTSVFTPVIKSDPVFQPEPQVYQQPSIRAQQYQQALNTKITYTLIDKPE